MSKKKLFYLIFFVILIAGFYIVVRPWLKKKDTISIVQPFRFTDQDGKPFTNKDVEGKVYVTEFFFTHCESICPIMNGNMQKIYNTYKGRPDFLILSHTCDPERDSVPQLKHYADSLKVDNNKWVFVTGRKDSLYTAARLSYVIDDPVNNLRNIEDDFLHTQFWALVNKKGEVKKIYDGLKDNEVNDLIADIRDQLND